MDKPEKIAIIGGGLSAIYAFQGALDAGYHPYSIDVLVTKKNPRLGSVFMYTSPIPWSKVKVESTLWGTCSGYAYKQWRDLEAKTSAHTRFDDGKIDKVLEDLYDPELLCQTLWSKIPIIRTIDFLTDQDLDSLRSRYRAVICTFPEESKKYDYQSFIVRIPISFHKTVFLCPIYVVIYNGLPEVPWIRKTLMPGRVYTEYPYEMSEDVIKKFEDLRESDTSSEITRVPDLKPDTPSLSWDDRAKGNLLRVGRQAIFDRKYLSHYAQMDTKKFLEEI